MGSDTRTPARTRHRRARTGAGWLAAAMTSLALLAAAAAVVSWDALLLAPASTLTVFRRWVIASCPPPAGPAAPDQELSAPPGDPAAPGQAVPAGPLPGVTAPGQAQPGPPPPEHSAAGPDRALRDGHPRGRTRAGGKPCKQDLLVALAGQRYDLRIIPLERLAKIATGISGEADLHPGTGRRILRAHVRTLQGQDTSEETRPA